MASAPPVRIAAPASRAAGIASSGMVMLRRGRLHAVRTRRLTAGTRALEGHLVGGDAETATAPNRADRAFQLLVVERDEAAAVATKKVMVVLAARAETLVTCRAAAKVEPLEVTEPLELLERAVNAGPPDLGQPAVYLRGRQRAG